jgi:hypothetical protein
MTYVWFQPCNPNNDHSDSINDGYLHWIRKPHVRRGSNPVEGSASPSVKPGTARTYAIYCGLEIRSMMILEDDFLITGRELWEVPICIEIVELHQGRIEVTSDENRGITFTMNLPIAQLEV